MVIIVESRVIKESKNKSSYVLKYGNTRICLNKSIKKVSYNIVSKQYFSEVIH